MPGYLQHYYYTPIPEMENIIKNINMNLNVDFCI